jgi:signal transduction histidine kinase
MIFAGIIEEDFGQTSETMKSVAREGLSSDNNAVTMIQEILGASNYKKGTIAYTLKETNFTDIVKEIFCSFTKEVDDRGLEFKLDIPEEALTVLIDRTQMSQVIRNTIDNSIKYTPTGTIKIIVKKTLVGNKEKVIFEVSDTGIGLSAKDKSMLFTEGGKGEDSLKYNTNSTGYGLYIVKKIVENHGGKIWAESAGRGKGSQFYVELDLVK